MNERTTSRKEGKLSTRSGASPPTPNTKTRVAFDKKKLLKDLQSKKNMFVNHVKE
jgi:hypothetical protein